MPKTIIEQEFHDLGWHGASVTMKFAGGGRGYMTCVSEFPSQGSLYAYY
jgi:hypothetical protein